jgi:hypothetical protein
MGSRVWQPYRISPLETVFDLYGDLMDTFENGAGFGLSMWKGH